MVVVQQQKELAALCHYKAITRRFLGNLASKGTVEMYGEKNEMKNEIIFKKPFFLNFDCHSKNKKFAELHTVV